MFTTNKIINASGARRPLANRLPLRWFNRVCAMLLVAALGAAEARSDDMAAPTIKTTMPAPPIAPAVSTQTGLLLQPPLTLTEVPRELFLELVSTVGRDRIGKSWTTAVTTLPEHSRTGVHGLRPDEVQEYMLLVKRWFEEGKARPVSDVGLISTQEDVIRQPMLNHVAAFANSTVRVYLLVQKTASDTRWSYYSIVQDLTLDPVLDYFAEIKSTGVRFEAASCYKCHSSGPLAIHPNREDLVMDAPLAAALNQHIAQQPRSRMYFPLDDPQPPVGKPLQLEFCSSCHSEDGERGPLFKLQAHPIRIMVDFGYMPPDRRLSPEEIDQLKRWLDSSD